MTLRSQDFACPVVMRSIYYRGVLRALLLNLLCAAGRTRTDTTSRSQDFESCVSTNSTTAAYELLRNKNNKLVRGKSASLSGSEI